MRRSSRVMKSQAVATGERSIFFKRQEPHDTKLSINAKKRQKKKIKIEIKEEIDSVHQLIPISDETAPIKLQYENQEETVRIPFLEQQIIKPEIIKDTLFPLKSEIVKRKNHPILKRENIEGNISDFNSPVILTEDEKNNLPSNFIPIYTLIKKMRSEIIAPVDTMGCAEIPITLDTEKELTPLNYRFQLLISLMLSSQTKDEINFKAMSQMKQYFKEQGFKDGICLEAIQSVDEKTLDKLIFSVGFHSRKAQYIKKMAVILRDRFNGDIPNTLEGLVGLPGVGPKMSYLTLQKAWNLNEGIGVDVHVDRLSKQFKWVNAKTCKTPEITRAELQKWLPRSLWGEINPVLVGFGQSICLPKGRRCDLCTLSKTKLCYNVDYSLLKKVEKLSVEELDKMNRTLRFQFVTDIEDLLKQE